MRLWYKGRGVKGYPSTGEVTYVLEWKYIEFLQCTIYFLKRYRSHTLLYFAIDRNGVRHDLS